jgi:hypothetical protein
VNCRKYWQQVPKAEGQWGKAKTIKTSDILKSKFKFTRATNVGKSVK